MHNLRSKKNYKNKKKNKKKKKKNQVRAKKSPPPPTPPTVSPIGPLKIAIYADKSYYTRPTSGKKTAWSYLVGNMSNSTSPVLWGKGFLPGQNSRENGVIF